MLVSRCKHSARSSRAPIASASCKRLPSTRAERISRSYSSATQKAEAPASALAMRSPSVHVQVQYSPITDDSLNAFLRKRAQEPITILPVPLPSDVDASSPLHDYYYSDNRSQHLLAIMDTCLNDCYDVPRAREIFEATRTNAKLRHLLKVGMFNKFLQSYGMMAIEHERHRIEWVKEAWMLFDRMEQSKENIEPNAETYITMLLLLMRFESISALVNARNAHELIEMIRGRNIPLPSLLPYCSMVTTDEEEQDELVRYISRAIAAMGLPKLVHEFTRAIYEVEGAATGTKAVTALPEVRPVMRLKPRGDVELEVKITEDGRYEEVRPVGDAKEEVYEVPFNLRQLRQSLQRLTTAHRTLGDNLFARQQILEQSAYDVAVERLKHEHEQLEKLQGNARLHGRPLRALMWDWHQKLSPRLEEDIRVLIQEEVEASSHSFDDLQLGSFLSLLEPEKLSLIVILDVLNLYGSQAQETSVKLTRALLSVGKAVEDEYKAETSRRYGIPVASYTQGLAPRGNAFSSAAYEVLLARRKAARQELQAAESFRAPWPQQIRLKVGSILVDCLMDVATVRRYAKDKLTGEELFEDQPAFHHGYDFVRGHKHGVIKVNAAVADRISRDSVYGTIHPRHLPMLTPPRPWLAIEDGGYLTSKTSVMRYKESVEQGIYLREASDQGKLEMIYSSLDVLGSTPWKINEDIFDVVLKVWNSGERFLKLPPAVYDGPEPQVPLGMEKDARAKATFLAHLREWNQEKANCHSQRCSVNYKLEIARSVLGERIYFPHNIDFRGRAYPVPPHFNHIGDDLSRGLLKFGESKPLGEPGLRWLKIHISNLYGFDKASLSERAEFTMSHLDDIYDSAEKPLEGWRWWMKADDPWQCLAACMELRAALESPDPSAFKSSLPIHQDGTCNGLQHYAALGGDKHGAAQVNLDVTERPSDVYTYVARMLDARVDKDAAEEHELAKLIQGKITRKIVKQTVMTTVYGVTFVGARDQIEKQLRERTEVPPEMRFKVSSYVAKQTLAAIGDLFIGAKAIQTWFSLTARLIAKSIPGDRVAHAYSAPSRKSRNRLSPVPLDRVGKEQMTSVVWTTILGLPVVQPYRKVKRRQIMTKQQSVYISDPNTPTEVDPMKQASAFPPNFVHSLDASHMMLTALACRSASITFAAVHDSYWTHASDVTQMSEYIRETFVELHSSDVLPRLLDEFRLRYRDHKVPAKAFLGSSFLQQLRDAGANFILPEHVETALMAGRGKGKKQNKKATDEEALKSEGELDRVEDQVAGKLKDVFLDLIDLIPPLPHKGDFEVANVKNSPYFFS